MTKGPWGCGNNHSLMQQRMASRLRGGARLDLMIEREEWIDELRQLDAEADGLIARRKEVRATLRQIRNQLWPVVPTTRGRRPPIVDARPHPPIDDDPDWLKGRRLRATCVSILRRRGATSLEDMHAALHLGGFAIESPRPVQALADAMGYEITQGRVVRVERGVYAPNEGWRPRSNRPLPDPFLHNAPEEWFPPLDRTGGLGEFDLDASVERDR